MALALALAEFLLGISKLEELKKSTLVTVNVLESVFKILMIFSEGKKGIIVAMYLSILIGASLSEPATFSFALKTGTNYYSYFCKSNS